MIQQPLDEDSLILSGTLYANGMLFVADDEGIRSADKRFHASSNTIINRPGLLLGYDGEGITFRM
jgi:hypothetical protein